MEKIIEIPEGYEARIEGNKVVLEPKGSEDERIRKAIINVFATHEDYEIFFGVSVEDILAYLEKQKGQKPAEWSEEDKRKLNRIYEILGHAAEDKGFLSLKPIIRDQEAVELQGFIKSVFLCRGKDWSDEDEKMRNWLVSELQTAGNPQRFYGAVKWLKALRQKKGWYPTRDQIQALYNILLDPKKAGSISDRASIVGLIHDLEKQF